MQTKFTVGTTPQTPDLNLKEQLQPHIESKNTLWSNLSEKREGAIHCLFGKDAGITTTPDGRQLSFINNYRALFIYRSKKVQGKIILSRELLQISRIREESDCQKNTLTPMQATSFISQIFDANGKVSRCLDSTPNSDSVFEAYQEKGIPKTCKVQYAEPIPTTHMLLFGEVDDIETNTWTDNVVTLAITLNGASSTYQMQCIIPITTKDPSSQGSTLTFFDNPIPNIATFTLNTGRFISLPGKNGASAVPFFAGGLRIEYGSVHTLDTNTLSIEDQRQFLETCAVKRSSRNVIMQKKLIQIEAASPDGLYYGQYQLDSLHKKITATFARGVSIGVIYSYDKTRQMHAYQMHIKNKSHEFNFNTSELYCYIDSTFVTLDVFLTAIQQTELFTTLMKQLPLQFLTNITQNSLIMPQSVFGENIGPIQEDDSSELSAFSVIPGIQHWHHYLNLFQQISSHFRTTTDYATPNNLSFALDWLQALLPLLIGKKPIPVSLFNADAFKKAFDTSLPMIQTLTSKKIPLSTHLDNELRAQLIKELKSCIAWIMRRLQIIYDAKASSSPEQLAIRNAIAQVPTKMLAIEQAEIYAMECQAQQQKVDLFTQATRESFLIAARQQKAPLLQAEKWSYDVLLRHHSYLLSLYSQLKQNEHRKSSFFQTVEQLQHDRANCLTDEDKQRNALLEHAEATAIKLHAHETQARRKQLEKEQSAQREEAARQLALFQKRWERVEQISNDNRFRITKDEKDERKTLVRQFVAEEKIARIAYAKTRENLVLEEERAYTYLCQQHLTETQQIAYFANFQSQEREQRKSIETNQLHVFSLFSQLKAEQLELHTLKDSMKAQREEIVAAYNTELQPYSVYHNQIQRVATNQKLRVSICNLIQELPLVLMMILHNAPRIKPPIALYEVTLNLYRIEIALFLKKKGVSLDGFSQELIEDKLELRNALPSKIIAHLDNELPPIVRTVQSSWLFLLQGNAFNPDTIRAEMEDCQPLLHHIKNRAVLKEYFCCTVFALCHSHGIPVLLENISPENAVYLFPETIKARQNDFRLKLSSELEKSPPKRSGRFFKPWADCETTVQEGASVYLETVDRTETFDCTAVARV